MSIVTLTLTNQPSRSKQAGPCWVRIGQVYATSDGVAIDSVESGRLLTVEARCEVHRVTRDDVARRYWAVEVTGDPTDVVTVSAGSPQSVDATITGVRRVEATITGAEVETDDEPDEAEADEAAASPGASPGHRSREVWPPVQTERPVRAVLHVPAAQRSAWGAAGFGWWGDRPVVTPAQVLEVARGLYPRSALPDELDEHGQRETVVVAADESVVLTEWWMFPCGGGRYTATAAPPVEISADELAEHVAATVVDPARLRETVRAMIDERAAALLARRAARQRELGR